MVRYSFQDSVIRFYLKILIYVSFSITDSDSCMYYLVVGSNFDLLLNSPRISFRPSCALSCTSFELVSCTCLLFDLQFHLYLHVIKHLRFCGVLSILSLLLLFCSFQVSHTGVIWWSFTGMWVRAYLLSSPGLFSVFWLTSTMLYFVRYRFLFWFPTPSALLQLQLVLPPLPGSITF